MKKLIAMIGTAVLLAAIDDRCRRAELLPTTTSRWIPPR